jgi:hypothetical protein
MCVRPPGDNLLDMESTSARTWVLPRSGRSAIGIRRHLERISCGIRAESGPIKPPEKRENPWIHA